MSRLGDRLLGLTGLAAFAGLLSLLGGGGYARAPVAAAAAVAPAAAVALAEPVRGAAPAAASADAAVDHSRDVELPDGTFVPALNGAENASPIATYWGPSPWSPIVGIERSSAGLDWFRHEDGSYSTTQMVWRKDLGRFAAMTRVAHPGPTPPAANAVASK